jgi:acyl-CoA synthetase (NDP forming)
MDTATRERVRTILNGVKAAGREQLLEGEVYQILRAIGCGTPRIAVLPPAVAADRAERRRACGAFLADSKLEGVVVKIQSPDILHKTEAGGIAFPAANLDSIERAVGQVLDTVRDRAPGARLEGILLCERIAYEPHIPGRELLLSLRQDPAFGPVVVAGIGGILTEWYGKLAPSATTWILSAHDERLGAAAPPDLSGIGPAFSILFAPSRLHHTSPIEPAVFWDLFRRFADLARSFGNDSGEEPFVIEEIEVNPLALIPGGAPVALDGVARIGGERKAPRRRRIEKVKNLLEPRSVAVVGASGKAMNAGRMILQNLRAAEGVAYGHIHAVHPKESEIDTIPCVKSIADLPEKVDLAVISVPAEAARDAIKAFVDLDKAHSIILIPGGFAETGATSLATEIIAAVENGRSRADGGPVLCGGNCLGIVSKRRYNTFFLPQYKLPFHDAPGDNLAAISQSGAYLVTLSSNMDGVIYPKSSISYGNQMDLTVSDFVEHYLDDAQVQVLACYLEGFQPLDGERFVALIREHKRRGRSVIVFKAGKTEFGAKAAASHTASLAGDYPVARALMAGAGAIVAETLNQFEDFTKAFTMLYDRIPTGCRVGIISNAGFECSAAMDSLYNLRPAAFSDETRKRLSECLPNIAHADNPIDATPMATTEQFVKAVEAMLDDPGTDALVVSAVPVTQALNDLPPDLAGRHGENIYSMASLPQELIRVFRSSKKPIVAAVDSGRLYDDCVVLLERAGIPTYRKIDRATRALSKYCSMRG